jgi:hypothetical protein
LYNDSDRPVYFAVFGSDSAGRLSVLGAEGKDSVAGMSLADRSWGEFDRAGGWGGDRVGGIWADRTCGNYDYI